MGCFHYAYHALLYLYIIHDVLIILIITHDLFDVTFTPDRRHVLFAYDMFLT